MSRAGAVFTPRLVLVRVIGRGAVLRLASAVGDGLAWGLVMVLSILDEGWNSGMEIFCKIFSDVVSWHLYTPSSKHRPRFGFVFDIRE